MQGLTALVFFSLMLDQLLKHLSSGHSDWSLETVNTAVLTLNALHEIILPLSPSQTLHTVQRQPLRHQVLPP